MVLMTSFDNSSQSDFFAAGSAAGSSAESIEPYSDELILLAWREFLKRLEAQFDFSSQYEPENYEPETHFHDMPNATFEMPGNLGDASDNMRSGLSATEVTLNSRDFLLESFGYGNISDVFEQCDMIKLMDISLNQL